MIIQMYTVVLNILVYILFELILTFIKFKYTYRLIDYITKYSLL